MTETVARVGAVAQDYLKAVWGLQEWSQEPVTTKALAARLDVGASAVSQQVRRLGEAGLLAHEPYGAITLTDQGRDLAVRMVRRHRLLETFLVAELGYGWDEVHDEAEVLEHAVSDVFVERMDARLGRPVRDPHGDPIPDPDGRLRVPAAVPLWDAPDGEVVVARISDADPELLRRFAELGLVLDAELRLGATQVTLGVRPVTPSSTGQPLDLAEVAARAIWVTPRPS